MKFDLIISNPPYNRNLDLKILKEVYEFSDKICFVHPAGWLYNNKEKNKNEIRHIVKDSFVYYEDVNDANKQFGIGVFSNVFITLFDKNTTDVIDIYSIDVHGSSDIYKSIKRKILNYCKNSNLLNHVSLNKKKYYCSFSKLRGHPGASDFYTFIQIKNE
ncbi:MAG TPA: hypothetical protein P5509_04215, partial [Bacteroidales bacterium]|nr:hypothetical protein [Bacteroidales bacterium]